MNLAEMNQLLTKVGPGTPMGSLMRHFWIPAVLSAELSPDGDPVRVKLLGEDLLAFRTGSGKVGLFDHRCPHRCASLFFGRNENEGIRCVYHGWKFAPDGTCLEQPNVVGSTAARIGVRAKAYPTIERHGAVFAYMGQRQTPPPFPRFPIFDRPPEEVAVWCGQRECNYLQSIEGDIDTSHAGFLHFGSVTPETMVQLGQNPLDVTSPAVNYKVDDTPYGVLAGGYRTAESRQIYWRFANFLFPFWTQPPPTPLGKDPFARAWVPMDDTHCMLFAFAPEGNSSVGNRGRKPMPKWNLPPSISFDYELLPNTTGWYGRWRFAQNSVNDFRISREQQRNGSYTGIEGVEMQDAAVCESMGAITDRTLEHLTASDAAVVQTRRALAKAALALQESHRVPPGVDDAEVYRQWSGYVMAPQQANWKDVYFESQPGATHTPDLV